MGSAGRGAGWRTAPPRAPCPASPPPSGWQPGTPTPSLSRSPGSVRACPVLSLCTVLCTVQAVYAWGGSSFGQCGTGKTVKVARPTRVELAGPARLLGAGYFTSIAVVGETVLVWGANPQVGKS